MQQLLGDDCYCYGLCVELVFLLQYVCTCKATTDPLLLWPLFDYLTVIVDDVGSNYARLVTLVKMSYVTLDPL